MSGVDHGLLRWSSTEYDDVPRTVGDQLRDVNPTHHATRALCQLTREEDGVISGNADLYNDVSERRTRIRKSAMKKNTVVMPSYRSQKQ